MYYVHSNIVLNVRQQHFNEIDVDCEKGMGPYKLAYVLAGRSVCVIQGCLPVVH